MAVIIVFLMLATGFTAIAAGSEPQPSAGLSQPQVSPQADEAQAAGGASAEANLPAAGFPGYETRELPSSSMRPNPDGPAPSLWDTVISAPEREPEKAVDGAAPRIASVPVEPVPAATGGPDAFGYTWVDSKAPAPQINYSWVEISGTGTNAGLAGDDAFVSAPIGFSFSFYGNNYTTAYFSTNGIVTFGSGSALYSNTALPNTNAPNNMLAAYWDDLDSNGGIAYYLSSGTAPNRVFVVEWLNWWTLGGQGPMTFEVVLFESSGDILFQYNALGTALGASASVGIENSAGTTGLQYSLNTASLQNGLAIRFARGPAQYEFTVNPPNQTNYGVGGGTVDHIVTISNTGTEDDAYDISTGEILFNGLTWNKQGMVVNVGATYDSRYAISPCVIKDNGTYKMWYSGNDGTNGHTMYATSPDGSAWTKYGMVLDHNSPYDSMGASDPTVLKVGSEYRMWYTAYDGTTYKVAYATSSDGTSWVKHGIVIDAGWSGELHAALPVVIFDAGLYKMWYNNYVAAYNVNYATSVDGVNWTKLGMVLPYGETYAESGVYSPDVVKIDGRYHMWYSGKSSSGTVRILYADSSDGLTWARHGVAVTYGPAYETSSVDRSCTMLDGNTVRMWYSGYVWSTPAYGRVMYATQTYSTQTGIWPVAFRNMADTNNITQVIAASGANASFIARVSIPPTATVGDFDEATVFATSIGNPFLQRSAEVRTEVSMTVNYSVYLSPSYQADSGVPGIETYYLLTVHNNGSQADTYDLQYSNNIQPWDVTFYDLTLMPISYIGPVASGDDAQFIVGVSVPPSALPGDYDLTDIYALSWNDFSVLASAQVRTTVNSEILLVDDDSGLDTELWFDEALTNLGYTYDYWNTDISGTPPAATTMLGHQAVIWMTGDNSGGSVTPGVSGDTLSVAERAEIEWFLNAGGRLYMSSGGLGWDGAMNGWYAWITQWFGAEAYNGGANVSYSLLGVDGDTIGDDLAMTIHQGDYCSQLTGLWTWNNLGANTSVAMLWDPDMANAVMKKTGGLSSSRAVYTAFDLSDVGGVGNRTALMDRIIFWLFNGDVLPDYRCDLEPELQSLDGNPGETVIYALSLGNMGAQDDTYNLSYLNSNLPWNVTFYDISWTQITSFWVPPMTVATVYAAVDIPAGASPGDFDVTDITATSQGDPGQWDTVQVQTQVPYDINPPTNVAIFQTQDPWGITAIRDILADWGIPYTVFGAADIGAVDLSPFDKAIFVGSDGQDTSLYQAMAANLAWFEDYVDGGGVMNIMAADWGDFSVMPFGLESTYTGGDLVDIAASGHRLLHSPNLITDDELDGWSSSYHRYFTDWPSWTVPVLTDGVTGNAWPVLLEFQWGSGRVIATGQPAEWAWDWSYSRILENLIIAMEGTSALPEHMLQLSPGIQVGLGSAGEAVDYNISLHNEGRDNDTFDLTYANTYQIWNVTFLDQSMNPITQIGPVQAGNSSAFIARVQIPLGTVEGAWDSTIITATSQGNSSASDFTIAETHIPMTAPFFDDMETMVLNRYSQSDMSPNPATFWEWGDPSSYAAGPIMTHSGTNCWGTNLRSEYQWGADIMLYLPPIDTTTIGVDTLSFWHWFNIESPEEDGGWVEVSTDMGTSWTQMVPEGGYPSQTEWAVPGYPSYVPCFAGTSGSWIYSEFNLMDYSGQVLLIRLRFWSEPWDEPGFPGWYVDDISVTVPPEHGCELLPDYQEQYADIGSDVHYTMSLTNTGSSSDTYNLSYYNYILPWPITFYGIDSVPLDNPSFEAGDFTGWSVADLTAPLMQMEVLPAGTNTGYGFFTSAPTDGQYSVQHGFDGDGPGHILLGQDVFIPSEGFTLSFDYRGAWDLASYGATLDRNFTVTFQPQGGGAPIKTVTVLTAQAGTTVTDTGILHADIDLSGLGGMSVFMEFDWWIPESFMGPGFFEFDNVKIIGSTGIQITQIGPLEYGETSLFDAIVSVPSDAQPGDLDLADIYADSQSDVTIWDMGQVMTQVPELNFTVSPAYQSSRSDPGAIELYQVTVTNNGPEDSYDLSCGNNTWFMETLDLSMNPISSLGPVPLMSSTDFYIRVYVPNGSVQGDFDLADVRVSSQREPALWNLVYVNTSIRGPTPSVLLLHSDDGVGEPLRSQLLSFGELDTVDVFDGRTATPTLAELQNYDVVVLWSNYQFMQPVVMGDILADYADSGGRVVDLMFSLINGTWGLQGRFIDELYNPIDGSSTLYSTGALGSFDNSHPIMEGVTDVTDYYRLAGTFLNPGSHEVARWNDGELFVAAKDDRSVVSITGYAGYYRMWTGQMDLLIHNAIFWISDLPDPYKCALSPSTQAGTGDPGDVVDYTLTLYNTGLNEDTYQLSYANTNPTWPVTLCDLGNVPIGTIGPIPPGGSMQFVARVGIPAGALPGDSDTASIYVQSVTDASSLDSATVVTSVPLNVSFLETTWAGGNSFAGNMFDVEVKVDMTIVSMDVHVSNPGVTVTFDVYCHSNTYVGFENSSAGWMLVGSGSGISQGEGSPTPIDLPDFDLPVGTYGFFVYQTSYPAANTIYTNGASVFENADMKITAGVGKGSPAFTGTTFIPRTWNGCIYYITHPTIDIDPPVHSNEFPTDGSFINDASPTISVDVTDQTGVNVSTVKMYVDGYNLFTEKTAIPGGYHVSYTHEGTFSDGEVVTCRIVARDVLGYLMDWTWTFTVDLTPPEVLWVSPPDGAGGVPLDSLIQVCFSEQMDQASAEAAFWTSPGITGTFSWNGAVMTLTPDTPLAFNVPYTLGIGGTAHDLAGNLLSSFTWGFSTGDLTPPEHSNEIPAIDGWTSEQHPIISVHVTDMYGVNASTIRFYIQGFRVDCAMTPISDGYNVSYWHEAGFAPGTVVACRIVAADMNGNALDFTWYFTVGDLNSFDIPIHYGWNLVSLPLIQANTSVEAVLAPLAGQWDSVKWYDPQDPADPWKSYRIGGTVNDLQALDHTMGFWLHSLANATLTVSGEVPGDTAIVLHAGWNLVGYPSLSNDTTIAESLFGTGFDRVEGYDASSPSLIRVLNGSYIMLPGEGYWVHVPTEAEWSVHWNAVADNDDARSIELPAAAVQETVLPSDCATQGPCASAEAVKGGPASPDAASIAALALVVSLAALTWRRRRGK